MTIYYWIWYLYYWISLTIINHLISNRLPWFNGIYFLRSNDPSVANHPAREELLRVLRARKWCFVSDMPRWNGPWGDTLFQRAGEVVKHWGQKLGHVEQFGIHWNWQRFYHVLRVQRFNQRRTLSLWRCRDFCNCNSQVRVSIIIYLDLISACRAPLPLLLVLLRPHTMPDKMSEYTSDGMSDKMSAYTSEYVYIR